MNTIKITAIALFLAGGFLMLWAHALSVRTTGGEGRTTAAIPAVLGGLLWGADIVLVVGAWLWDALTRW